MTESQRLAIVSAIELCNTLEKLDLATAVGARAVRAELYRILPVPVAAEPEGGPCCTECGLPAHWGRTREGVCRQCHEESRRDPSTDTEGSEVRGY